MKRYRKNISLVLLVLCLPILLSACGTTSGLKAPAGRSLSYESKYDEVIVQKFQDQALVTDVDPIRMDWACRHFATQIGQEIEKSGNFLKVSQEGVPQASTLLIGGNITRLQEGNSATRFLVGMGMGSSYLDATVIFKDGLTEQELAIIEVDKNSWGGGGALAAGQTPETFMEGAAKKVAKEAKKLSRVPSSK
jgi:predicted small secreted protein